MNHISTKQPIPKKKKNKLSTTTGITDTAGYIELTVCSDLLSAPDSNNKQKIVKKNIQTRVSIYIHDIEGHEEILGNKGNVIKNHCRIYHRNLGPLTINHTYDYITTLKMKQCNPEIPTMGFKLPTNNTTTNGKSK